MSWDYAELSKIAKQNGGPSKLIHSLVECGKKQMIPVVGSALAGGVIVTLGIQKIIKYLAEKKERSTIELEEAKKELIAGIHNYTDFVCKPYTILHMLVSIDGKITGNYMNTETAGALCEEYYRINREYQADAYVCGRITMEGSFTGGVKPDLAPYQGANIPHEDYVAKQHEYYAVSIDPHGRLGWYGSEIKDEDPGYDNAHIIEVLTDDIRDEYLAFLKEKGISYIFCGKDKIDVKLMNEKLYSLYGIKKLMLEGGGLTDSLFLDADCIDEMSLVVIPLLDGSKESIDLFAGKNCDTQEYDLKAVEKLPQNGLWLNYKRK